MSSGPIRWSSSAGSSKRTLSSCRRPSCCANSAPATGRPRRADRRRPLAGEPGHRGHAMSETDGSPSDVRQFRRGLRDLAALSALPVVWTGSDPRRIAESLADALLHMLHLEIFYILVRDRANEIPIEVAHTARGPALTARAEDNGRAL